MKQTLPLILVSRMCADPETYITYSRYYADRDDWNTAAEKMNQAIALGRQLDSGVIKDFKKHGIQLRSL